MAIKDQTSPTKTTKNRYRIERLFTRAHVFLYRISGGKIGKRLGQAPVFLLTTTGRKSGRQFTTPLLYLRDGERLVTVASHGGAPKHPTWWLNLQSNPRAIAQVDKQKLRVTAAQASPEERERLWPLLVEIYPAYADYEKKTTREIPVVILTPRVAAFAENTDGEV